MGPSPLLTRTPPRVRTEAIMHVLVYRLKRLVEIMAMVLLIAAKGAWVPSMSPDQRSGEAISAGAG